MQGQAVWQRARWLLALVGLCALATCPAAIRECRARRHAREAPAMLGYLIDAIRAHVAAHGTLPDVTAGPTPPIGSCCENGSTCAPDPSLWTAPGWQALRFSVDGRHRFSYQVAKDGPALVLTATGDQDCDGVFAVYEVRLTVVAEHVFATWKYTDPLE
ncbi:MAG TPA: hypothetical protein VHE35_32760 [Kofleriaceae bacterium]|nr:hypothetical protein [Kofleriaceae bacterium]